MLDEPTGLIPARAGKTVCIPPGGIVVWAHPRACGENRMSSTRARSRGGSSPRVRGKPGPDRHERPAVGLIPARAGKTSTVFSPPPRGAAHPRACGENLLTPDSDEASPGSSPRVRGKPGPRPRPWQRRRLIPARAGKTPRDHQRRRNHRAHPRACGENDELGDAGLLQVRLIPARAGKTGRGALRHYGGAAHPRACGENAWPKRSTFRPMGSSPRVRGKRGHSSDRIRDDRLIPARAGKTPHHHPHPGARPAHPRACGENWLERYLPRARQGSSPRVRGKPAVVSKCQDSNRLIPARAGKTTPILYPACPEPAHPRACGENPLRAPGGARRRGSSPRVRGKRRCRLCLLGRPQRWRLIPARAGKTCGTWAPGTG